MIVARNILVTLQNPKNEKFSSVKKIEHLHSFYEVYLIHAMDPFCIAVISKMSGKLCRKVQVSVAGKH